MAFAGKAKQVHWIIWLVAALFLVDLQALPHHLLNWLAPTLMSLHGHTMKPPPVQWFRSLVLKV